VSAQAVKDLCLHCEVAQYLKCYFVFNNECLKPLGDQSAQLLQPFSPHPGFIGNFSAGSTRCSDRLKTGSAKFRKLFFSKSYT